MRAWKRRRVLCGTSTCDTSAPVRDRPNQIEIALMPRDRRPSPDPPGTTPRDIMSKDDRERRRALQFEQMLTIAGGALTSMGSRTSLRRARGLRPARGEHVAVGARNRAKRTVPVQVGAAFAWCKIGTGVVQ